MANGRIMTLRLRTKNPFSLVRSRSFIIVFGVRKLGTHKRSHGL
ncbi:hypothetical protein Hanom_Chr05g00420121 [Helianthus anomalus]